MLSGCGASMHPMSDIATAKLEIFRDIVSFRLMSGYC